MGGQTPVAPPLTPFADGSNNRDRQLGGHFTLPIRRGIDLLNYCTPLSTCIKHEERDQSSYHGTFVSRGILQHRRHMIGITHKGV